MSACDENITEMGKKIEEMKVVELKKELEKLGLRRTGGKAELLSRLREALQVSTSNIDNIVGDLPLPTILPKESPPSFNKSDFIEPAENCVKEKIQSTIYPQRTFPVDLDDSDDIILETNDLNQSVDTLELGVPIDDILNPLDETPQEDQIQINLSKAEEADMNMDSDNQLNTEEDKEQIYEDLKVLFIEKELIEDKLVYKSMENDIDDTLNIDLETQIEMYEEDNNDVNIENRKENEIMKFTVKNEINVQNDDNKDEAEEGEVITVPITSRLGKRKVITEHEASPKKSKKKGLKETKGTGHIIEEPCRMISPRCSKNIISDILRVDNLVRPFTMTQLQDVLSITGRVADLWLNKIKSIAYVRYESESVAINARESLDGCKWPSINPKLLVADFATYKEMEWMKENGDSGVNPPEYLRHQEKTTNAIVPIIWRDIKKSPESSWADRNKRQIQEDKLKREYIKNSYDERQNRDEKKNRDEKQNQDEKNNRDEKSNRGERRSRNIDEKQINDLSNHKRQSHSVDKRRPRGTEEKEEKGKRLSKHEKRHASPPPVKSLDDLFRKTIAQPSIYWLPVSRDRVDASKV